MPTQINKGNLLKCSRRFLETNINISSEGPKVGRLLTKLKQNME